MLVAYADPDGGDDVHDLGLVHAACFAIIERSALVTTAFTVVGKQIMHARPEYRARVDTVDGTPPMINELVASGAQRERPERPITGGTGPPTTITSTCCSPIRNYENPDPEHLTDASITGERFVLYRIDQSQIADVGKTAKG